MSEWAKDILSEFLLESADWAVFSFVCDASSCSKDQIQLSSPCYTGKHFGAGWSPWVSGIKPGRHSLGSRCPGEGVRRQGEGSLW